MDWTIDDLIAFREQFSSKKTLIDDISWHYYDSGNLKSDLAIVFLHGTVGSKDVFWFPINAL